MKRLFSITAFALFALIFCGKEVNAQISMLKDYKNYNSATIGVFQGITYREGGFSTLFPIQNSDGKEFWTISDRGVNIDAASANPTACHPTYDKIYAFQNYAPKIHRIRVNGDSIQILQTITMKRPDGTTTTGLLNPAGFGSTALEQASTDTVQDCANFSSKIAPKDVWGIDSEGLVVDSDGNFWICEEGGPTVWKLNPNGVVIKRYTPYANQVGAQSIDVAIDTVFKYRKNNRGFEGISITPNGKIYAIIQSPILFPTQAVGEASRIHRILEIDPKTEKTRMFAYVNAGKTGSGSNQVRLKDWKIGDMAAVNDSTFLVIEVGIRGTTDLKKIYQININQATNIDSAYYGGLTLEALVDSAGLAGKNIKPVQRTLFLDLVANGWPSELDKCEGLAIINDSLIAVANDNDFGQYSPNEDGVGTATGKLSHLFVFSLSGANKIQNLYKSSISLPKLITNKASSITATSALAAGIVTNNGNGTIKEKGFLFGLSSGVNLYNKTGQNAITTLYDGTYASTLTGLAASTTYYYVAYAKNESGIGYGSEVSFTTLQGLAKTMPIIISSAVTSIKTNSAIAGGNVISDGNSTISERGVIWAQNSSLDLSMKLGKSGVSRTGLGVFNVSISGLNAATQYFVRAYAVNNYGTAYGDVVSFSTLSSIPTVAIDSISSVSQNSASVYCNAKNAGSSAISSRGVVYSSDSTFATYTQNAIGSGVGIFAGNLSGLNANALYYIKAFATNLYGTAYSSKVSFTTLSNPSIVLTVGSLRSSKAPNYASGAIDSLSYTVSGAAFGANNKITAELSDATGSFSSNTTLIGEISSQNSGKIAITLPYSLSSGSYKIRLKSTSPIIISSNTTATLNIKPIKDYLNDSLYGVCNGSTSAYIGLDTNAFEGANRYSYSWTSPVLLDNGAAPNPRYIDPTNSKVFNVTFASIISGANVSSKNVYVGVKSQSVLNVSSFVIVPFNQSACNLNTLANLQNNDGSYFWRYSATSAAPLSASEIANYPLNAGANVFYVSSQDVTGCFSAQKKFTVYRRAYRSAVESEPANANTMEVYPNVFESEINVFAIIDGAKSAKAKMIDLLGNTVVSADLEVNNGIVEAKLQIPNIANGTYLLVLENGELSLTQKIVRVK